MREPRSATRDIRRAVAGASSAERRLFIRYRPMLERIARLCLPASARRMADENDVVNAAFGNLLFGIRDGRFTSLADRDELERLLRTLVRRRAAEQLRREQAHDRRCQRAGEAGHGGERSDDPLSHASVRDLLGHLELRLAADRCAIEVARLLVRGHGPAEIAAHLGCSPRTVNRKVDMIRRCTRSLGDGDD